MSSANIIQLRQMLSEKFPGLRMHLDESPLNSGFWPTGVRRIDEALCGGLPRGALIEIVAGDKSSGSASFLCALLRQAAEKKQIIAVIDGSDSLDVAQGEESVLSRLLWIRCHSAIESLKAADLVLRDGNLPLVILDLKRASEKELHRISPTAWYRFQRLVEETNAICLILTPRQMIAPAQVKITLHSRFSIADLERTNDELLRKLEIQVSDARQLARVELTQSTA